MDPNNNTQQPINTNPMQALESAVPAAVTPPTTPPVTPPTTPAEPVAPVAPLPQAPKSKSKKGLMLLIIIVLLIIGMGSYILFANNRLDFTQKTTTENTSAVIPTATAIPTPPPPVIEDINIASPDADLKSIESDLQGL